MLHSLMTLPCDSGYKLSIRISFQSSHRFGNAFHEFSCWPSYECPGLDFPPRGSMCVRLEPLPLPIKARFHLLRLIWTHFSMTNRMLYSLSPLSHTKGLILRDHGCGNLCKTSADWQTSLSTCSLAFICALSCALPAFSSLCAAVLRVALL